jgi:flagellar FliL protein
MSAEEHGAEKPADASPKKSKKKLILIVVGVVGLLGGAGVPLVLMTTKEPPKEEAVEEEHHEPVQRIENADLGQFIVNLSESTSFLKTKIMMEYDGALIDKQLAVLHGEDGGKAHGGGASGGGEEKAGGGIHPHVVKNENKFRDVVIRVLSSKKAAELLTGEGKARLKEELVDGLNEAMGLEEPPVVGVLFTEFIIQ